MRHVFITNKAGVREKVYCVTYSYEQHATARTFGCEEEYGPLMISQLGNEVRNVTSELYFTSLGIMGRDYYSRTDYPLREIDTATRVAWGLPISEPGETFDEIC